MGKANDPRKQKKTKRTKQQEQQQVTPPPGPVRTPARPGGPQQQPRT